MNTAGSKLATFQSDWQFDNSALDSSRANASSTPGSLGFTCYFTSDFCSIQLGDVAINAVRLFKFVLEILPYCLHCCKYSFKDFLGL